jgi:histidine ammonia-lyase
MARTKRILRPDQLPRILPSRRFAESVVAVARHGARVTISEEARERSLASRRHVEGIIDEERPVYGVTTGFGACTECPRGSRISAS